MLAELVTGGNNVSPCLSCVTRLGVVPVSRKCHSRIDNAWMSQVGVGLANPILATDSSGPVRTTGEMALLSVFESSAATAVTPPPPTTDQAAGSSTELTAAARTRTGPNRRDNVAPASTSKVSFTK
ncbi:hypothetical protein D3C75_1057650 [compost metagenome]